MFIPGGGARRTVRDPRANKSIEEFSMPLGDHIEELRRRVLKCLVLIGIAVIVAAFFCKPIMEVLKGPHVQTMNDLRLNPSLKFGTYPEPFIAQLKACLIASLAFCAPYLLYQAWAFIMPALYRRERRTMLRIGVVSLLCFAAGVLFGYFLFIPLALRFLLTMSGADTEPVLMIGSYLSLLFMLTLALGVVFQTPLVVYHLVTWKIVSVEQIQKHRKSAILIALILAAFLTPPDPFTQIMMAVPLILLYDLGALAAAPTRRALKNFVRFAGTLGLIGAVVAGFFFLWPVGSVSVAVGSVNVAGRALSAGEEASLRRGQVCVLPQGAAVRFRFGRRESSPTLLVAGEARLQVHGSAEVSIYAGRAFADNSRSGRPLEVRTSSAQAILHRGHAEFVVPEPRTLTVKVTAGEAVVRAEGRTVRIPAGRTATFRQGGQPLEETDLQERWERIMRGESAPEQ